jgi:hypothetical protein
MRAIGEAVPKVSVVTPTKNRLGLLIQTMDSVAVQTLDQWEHIVVDDGSDDGSIEEVERRAAADPRVRLIKRVGPASGANVCRNIGIRTARAGYILFLDSDDLLDPGCLARRVAVLDRNADLDFVTFQTSFFVHKIGDRDRHRDRELLGDDLTRFLYFELPWIITGPLWRKSALQSIGLFDESLPSWQDVDLHVRAIAAGLRYLRFGEVDHHMRWQDAPDKVSIQQRRMPEHLLAAQTLMVKFEGVVSDGPGMTWVRQRALCSLYFFIAERWMDIGRVGAALACWRCVRTRHLAPAVLYLSGIAMLMLYTIGPLGRRIGHKWKGLARLRTNPELVVPR